MKRSFVPFLYTKSPPAKKTALAIKQRVSLLHGIKRMLRSDSNSGVCIAGVYIIKIIGIFAPSPLIQKSILFTQVQ